MVEQWSDPITPGLGDKRPPPRKREQEAGAIIIPPSAAPSSWAKCRECRATFAESELVDGVCEGCREEKQEEAEAEPAPEPPRRETIREAPRVHAQNGAGPAMAIRAELRLLDRLATELERLTPAARGRVAAWLSAWLEP